MDIVCCNLSVASIYEMPSDTSLLLTQMLYGEECRILEIDRDWARVVTLYDEIEGWVDYKQLNFDAKLSPKTILKLPYFFQEDMLLSIGSEIESFSEDIEVLSQRESIEMTARKFLNVPYLQGGRSYFGIDSGALVQLIMKVNGIKVPRHVSEQAALGYAHAFVEESEAGDLAFFENKEGDIFHVGLMLNNHQILHSYGKVRVDVLDSSGIFNIDLKRHTHKLRFVKNIL